MSSVANLDPQSPTPFASARPTPFPKADKSFEGALIAATTGQVRQRWGLSAPTPSRATPLRMPSSALRLTPGIPAGSGSPQATFRPLPLSGPSHAGRTGTAQPATSSPEPPASPRSLPAPPDIMTQQLISDYQECQKMMEEKATAATQVSPARPETGDLSSATGESSSPDVSPPFPRALSASGVLGLSKGGMAPVFGPVTEGEQTVTPVIERIPRTPFPRRGEVPIARPLETAPQALGGSQPQRTAVGSYKDDQLLANAGGDEYVREAGTVRVDPSYDHSRFKQRVGKDLRDAAENLRDAAGDLSLGTTSYARSPSGEITARRRPGLLGTLGNFAKDAASGVTLGLYRREGEPAPRGLRRVVYPFKKIVVDAVLKDLVVGVPGSLLRTGEHTTLAALNTAETIPDATIGNFDKGRKITSAAFDATQVGVSYLADVLPSGEAWSRVGAPGRGDGWGIPVVTNLKSPEYDPSDPRFDEVRNTPFRKGIETVGTFGAGALLSAASTPVAVLGTSAVMRTGSELNARQASRHPSSALTSSTEPERVASSTEPVHQVAANPE